MLKFVVVIFLTIIVVESEEDVSKSEIGEDGDKFNFNDDGKFLEKLTGERSENGHRSIHSNTELNANDPEEFQKLSLKRFLETYAKKHHKKQNFHSVDTSELQEDSNKDPKGDSWVLMDVQRHQKHPYKDRKGWVALDPVQYSITSVYGLKNKPSSERPWNEYGPLSSQRPYLDENDDFVDLQRPISITPPSQYIYSLESSDRFDLYGDRPRPTLSSTIYQRPTSHYGQKVHLSTYLPSSTSRPVPSKYEDDFKRPRPYPPPHGDIITDGLPANFPHQSHYNNLRRQGSEMEINSGNRPMDENDKEWVQLFVKKTYKPPRSRQRSLQLDSTSEPTQILRTSRGVRLTVLPPLKNSSVNMTTSHGGLLQVESTFDSVEQAKEKHDKKKNKINIKVKRKRKKGSKKGGGRGAEDSTRQNLTTGSQYGDPGAVMAAVGAGMIPATMAMMVPLAMSG